MYRSDTQIATPVKGRHKAGSMQGEAFMRHSPAVDGINGVTSPQRKSGRKYETFVMTGDMMIRTTSDHGDADTEIRVKNKEVHRDHDTHAQEGSGNKRKKTEHSKSKIPKFNTAVPSPKAIPRNSSIPTAVTSTNQKNKSPVLGRNKKSSPKSAKKVKRDNVAEEFHTGLPVFNRQAVKESPKTVKHNIVQGGHSEDNPSPIASPRVKVKTPNSITPKHASGIPTKMSKIPTKDTGQQEKPLGGRIEETPVNCEPSGDTKPPGQEVSEVSGERIGGTDLIMAVTSAAEVQQPSGQNGVLSEEISCSIGNNNEQSTLGEEPHLNGKPISTPSENTEGHISVPSDCDPAIDNLFDAMRPTFGNEQQPLKSMDPLGLNYTQGKEPVMDMRSPFEDFQRPVYHACAAVPIQLDIPPDDICSEDERYSCSEDGLFDVDNLPPPPEELLYDFEEEKTPIESAKQDIHIGGAFFMENIRHRENSPWTSPYGGDTNYTTTGLNHSDLTNTVSNTDNRYVTADNLDSVMQSHDEKELKSHEPGFSGQEESPNSRANESIDLSHSINGENIQYGTTALRDCCRVTASDQSHTNEQNAGSSILNHVTQGNELHYNNAMTSITGVPNRTVPVALLNGETVRTACTAEANTPIAVSGTAAVAVSYNREEPSFSNNSIIPGNPVADLFSSSAFPAAVAAAPNSNHNNSTSSKSSGDEPGNIVCNSTAVCAVNKLPENPVSLSTVQKQPQQQQSIRGEEATSVRRCNINDRAQPAPVFPLSEDIHRTVDRGHQHEGEGEAITASSYIHEDLLEHVLESQTPMDSSFNVPTPPADLAIQSQGPDKLDYLSQVACKAANAATSSSLIGPDSRTESGQKQQHKQNPEELKATDDNDNNDKPIESELFPSGDEYQNKRGMVTSFSGEGFAFKTLPNKTARGDSGSRDSPLLVRTSKSHENYLDNEEMTMINIDFGDNFASSVDALPFDQSSTSLDKYNGYSQQLVEQSKSLDNSPERRYDKYSEKIHMPTFFRIDEPRHVVGGSKVRDSGHKMKYTTKPGSDGSDSSGSLGEVSPTRTVGPEQPLSPTYSIKSEGSSPVHRAYQYDSGTGSGGVPATGGGIRAKGVSPKEKNSKQMKPKKIKSASSSPAHDGLGSTSIKKTQVNSHSDKSLPSVSHAIAAVVVDRNVHQESQDLPQTLSEHSQSEVSDVLSDREDGETPLFGVVVASPPVQNGYLPDDSVNRNVNNDNNVDTSGISQTPTKLAGSSNFKLQNCDFQMEELSSEPKSPRKSISQNSSTPQEAVVVPESVQTSKSRQSPKHRKNNKTDKASASATDGVAGDESPGHHNNKSKSPNKEGQKKHRSPKGKKGQTESPNKLKFLDGDDETPPPPYSPSAASALQQSQSATESSPPANTRLQAASAVSKPESKPTAGQESRVKEGTSLSPKATRSDPQAPPVSKPDLPPQLDVVPPGSGPSSPDSDTGSIYHQPLKDVDLPSAQRLAKRLYDLEGFKKQDISKHLSKKNDFAQQVGEEFLKYFDFSGQGLDSALRTFLRHITLAGETQERERVLVHFSHRFLECNPGSYNSEDAAHTLTCALLLLNTDLHGQNVGQKMSQNEFIENLSDLNDGENFPKEVLKSLFHSIKSEPLEWEFDEGSDGLQLDLDLLQATTLGVQRQLPAEQQKYLGHNPFLDVPDPNNAIEYKKGYVMRKCCVDPDGRKTAVGKRGWKMFFGVLKEMVFYLYKDEHAYKKSVQFENFNNAIRVHHALTTKAADYKKKQHVFRLQTAEWAEYLFQTSSPEDCQNWIDNMNLVAASFSAPPLPGAVGSQRKFQRPLLPASCTKYNLREQYQHHEQKLQHLEHDLAEHRKYPPEKGSKARLIQEYIEKEQYMQFELRRFKTYVYLLQSKMSSYPCGDLEPSLVETTICEVSEPSSPGVEHKDSEVMPGRPVAAATTSGSSPKPSSSSSARKSPKRTDKDRKSASPTSPSSSSGSSGTPTQREKKTRSSVQRSQSDRVNRDRKAKSLPERLLLQRYKPGDGDCPDSYGTPV